MKFQKNPTQKLALSLLIVATLFVSFWQMREVSWAAPTYVVCPTLTPGCTHRTIAEAIAATESVSTIQVTAGTYVEQDLRTEGKDITFTGIGAAVISGKNTAPILTISRGTVGVSGLTFIASGKGKANGINVSLATTTISNCTFTNLTGTAIAIDPGTVTLSGNNISGNSYGVTANNMSSLTMNNNTVSGSTNAGVVLSSSSTLNSSAGNNINTNGTNGIELSSSSATLGNNNLIYSNADNGIAVTAGGLNITGTGNQIYDNSNNGISISGATFTVKYSKIFENGAAGINATAASTCTSIDQNAIYANTTGIQLDAVTACTIDNNTIDGNDTGISANHASTATVTDNAVTYNTTYGLYNSGDSTITTNYNDYFGNGTNLSGQTAGANDVFVNPFYTDRSHYNFVLQAESLLVNLGQSGVDLGYQPSAVISGRDPATGVIVDDEIVGATPGTTADTTDPSDGMAALLRAKSAGSWESGLLQIKAGSYSDQNISIAASNITIAGEDRDLVTIDGNDDYNTINVTSGTDNMIQGLTLTDTRATTKNAIKLESGAGVTVQNVIIDGTHGNGIETVGGTLVVLDSIIRNTENSVSKAIFINGGSNSIIRGNQIYQNTTGVTVQGAATGTILDNNVLDHNTTAITIADTASVTITDNSLSYSTTAISNGASTTVTQNYNNFWSNTTNLSGLSASWTELYVNPFYTDIDTNDYSLLDGSLLADLGSDGVNIGYQPDAETTPRAEAVGVYAGTGIVGNTPGSTADTTDLNNAVAAATRAQTALSWTTGTLHLLAGTYNTQGVRLTSNISIVGAGAANTIINGDTSGVIIYTEDQSENITISNLGFTDTGAGQASAITIGADTSGMVVSDCRFTNISDSAITNYGPEGSFMNNIISGSGLSGIKFESGAACTGVQGNLIYDSIEAGLDLSSSGACAVTYNTLDNNANGVYANGATDLTLTDNLITNNNTAITFETTTATLTNNNYWGNSSNFSGVEAGTSDLFLNPFYSNLASDDYRLLDDSLMIGMASNNSANIGYTYDASGTARVTAQIIVDDSIGGNTPLTTADTLSLQTAENAAGHAYTALSWASATIAVGAGTYEESLIIDTDNLTIQGTDLPTITSDNEYQTVLFSENIGGALSGFILENTGDGNVVALTDSTAEISDNTLQKTAFELSLGSGIYVNNPTVDNADLLIAENEIKNMPKYGIHVLQAPVGNPEISTNRIHNNTDGIFLETSGTATILDNTIYRNAGHGILITATTATPARLLGNTIDKNVGYGIYVTANEGEAPYITNNIISLNQEGGVLCSGTITFQDITYSDLWSNGGNADSSTCSGGAGVIDSPPRYYGDFITADSSDNDYYLCSGSPALETGENGVNMGAYQDSGESGCPFRATDSYISPTGNNFTGDGSAENPWATLGFAAQYTLSGTVHLSSGDFTSESYPIYLPNGLSAEGASAESTSMRVDANHAHGDNVILSDDAILAYGNQNIENINFLWAPHKDTSYGIKIIGDSVNYRHNIFNGYRDSQVRGSNGVGIKDADEVSIFNNLFYNFGNDAVTCLGNTSGCTNTTVSNNTFHDIEDSAIHVYNGASGLDTSNNIISTSVYGINNQDSATVRSDYNDFNFVSTSNYVNVSAGEHDLYLDPLFYEIELDNGIRYQFLSHLATGQDANSPLFDVGSGTAVAIGLNAGTTRADYYPDLGTVDLGAHLLGNVTPWATFDNDFATWETGAVTVNYNLSDENLDLINFLEESGYTIEYSTDSAEWYDATDAGGDSEGYEDLASSSDPGTDHLFIWNATTDLGNYEDDTVQIRLLPKDGTLSAPGWVLSNEFGFDNIVPVVDSVTIQGTPSSGDERFYLVPGTITETYPDRTLYYFSIDGGAYSEPLADNIVEDDTTEPGVNKIILTDYSIEKLNGDERVQVKISHFDQAGNTAAVESEVYYVTPLTPQAPLLANETSSTMDLTIVPNAAEAGDVLYAIYVNNTEKLAPLTGQDDNWHEKYVAANGTPSDTAVWQTFSAWNETITLSGLFYNTDYTLQVQAANPQDTGTTSEWSEVSSLATTAGYPTVTLNSATAQTDGTGLVAIEIAVSDDEDDPLQANLLWSATADGTFLPTTINGTSATAAYEDSEGPPAIDNEADYRIGAVENLRIATSEGENTVSFNWDSKIDLFDADGTYYLKAQVNDGLSDQYSSVISVDLDNVAPVIATPVALSSSELYSTDQFEFNGAFSESNPGSNRFRYKLDGVWSDWFVGESGTETPTAYVPEVTLNGTQSIDGLELEHVDAFGNSTVNANTEVVYIIPMTPDALTLSEPTSSSLKVSLHPNEEELGTVNYALLVGSVTPQTSLTPPDTSWVDQYVSATGTPSATPVWQNAAAWGASLTLSNLSYYNEYCLSASAANPRSSNETTSEESITTCLSTTAAAPTLKIISAAQNSEGTQLSNVKLAVSDQIGATGSAKIEYATSSSGPFSKATILGDSANAEYSDTLGAPKINNLNEYQIGTLRGRKIVTAYQMNLVENEVDFIWESGTDLPTADGTYYIKAAIQNEYGSSGSAVQSITLDNVSPVVAEEVHFVNLPLTSGETFSLQASFSETNPNLNAFAYNLNNPSNIHLLPLTEYSNGDSNTATPGPKEYLVNLDGNDCFYAIKARHIDDFGNQTISGDDAKTCVRPLKPATPTLSNATLNSIDLTVNQNAQEAANDTVLYAIQVSESSDTNWQGKYVNASGQPSASAVWQLAATWDTVTVQGTDPETTYTFQTISANPQSDGQTLSEWSDEASLTPSTSLISNGEGGGDWSEKDSWKVDEVTPAASAPRSIDRVTILSGDTITLDPNTVTVRQITINNGGSLIFADGADQTLTVTGNVSLSGSLSLNAGNTLEITSDSSSIGTLRGLVIEPSGKLELSGEAGQLASLTATTQDGLHNTYVYAKAGAEVSLDYAELSYLGANFSNYYGLYLEGVDSTLVGSGLTLTNSKLHHNYYGIYLNTNSNSNTLTANEVYSNQGVGIYVVNSAANTLSQNTIHDNSSNGVYLLNADSNTLTGNQSYGNSGSGFYLASAEQNTLNANLAYENTQNGVYLLDSDQNLFSRNLWHDNTGSGLSLNLSNENSFARDGSYKNAQSGILLSDSSNNTLSNTNIYRNSAQGVKVSNDSQADNLVNLTVYDNGTYGIELSGTTKFPSQTLIKNSIIAMNDSTELIVSGATETQLDYNNVYDANNQEYNGITADLNAISTDPLFLNTTTPDLHLSVVSPSRDAGNPASAYSNEPEPNGDRINQGSYGNTEEATKSEPATVIGSVSQATDGSGYISIRFSLTRASNLAHSLKVEYSPDGGTSYYDPHLLSSSSGTLNNSTEYQLANLSPGVENVTLVWDTKNSLNSGGSLDSLYKNNMKLRLTTFAEVANTPVVSSTFALDNKLPVVATNVNFANPPTAGDGSILLTVSFNEENPSLTEFAYALNGTTYSSYLTANAAASPTDIQLPITLTSVLYGDDYFTKLKARHLDKFGNEAVTENLTATYITPLVPGRPTFSQITENAASVTIVPNSQEQGAVLYALVVDESTPEDNTWQDKYLDQNGNPSNSTVYQTLSAWGTPSFKNLKSNTNYLVKVKAANPYQTEISSAFSTGNSFTTSAADNEPETTGSLSGFVFVDADQNGKLGGQETGLAGVTVRMYSDANANGKLETSSDTLEDSKVSSAAGYFLFDNLNAATYFLTVNSATVPPDYQATGAASLTINLSAGQDQTEQNFGYYLAQVTPPPTEPELATVSGKVFWDKNGNGSLDPSDSYLDNIEVALKQSGQTIKTANSNSLGSFSFTQLTAGNYTLKVTVPSNYRASTSDTVNLSLQAGEDYAAALFGLQSTSTTVLPPTGDIATLGGKVFVDTNRNDSFDTNESGVAGIEVSLSSSTLSTGNTMTLTTDASGAYSFSDLADGSYLVSVDGSTLPANLSLVVYSQNSSISNQQAVSSLDFPCYTVSAAPPEEPSVEDELQIQPEDDEATKSDKETQIEDAIKDNLNLTELPKNKAIFSSFKRTITTPVDQDTLNVSSNAEVQMLISAGQGILKIESVLEYNGIAIETYYPSDYNQDGIYTLDFNAPPNLGDHVLRTFITYADNRMVELTNKVIVDPEGYVYETLTDGQEKRISDALVTIYAYSNLTSQFEVWPAASFNQVNPQITKKQGSYQFLVPNGRYYIEVKAPGYYTKQTNIFEVKVTRPVNLNIELEPKFQFNTTILKFLIGILALGMFVWLTVHTKQSYDERKRNAIKKGIQRERELAQKESKKTSNEKRKIER